MFWLAPNCFTPDIGEVGTKYLVSVDNVRVSDGAIFEKIQTYQTLVLALRGCADHAHETSCLDCLLDLLLGEAFEVSTNRRQRSPFGREYAIVDKHVCCTRVFA